MSRRTGPGVVCPACGSPTGPVIDTRCRNGFIHRRRECPCGMRYTTQERVVRLGKRNVPSILAADIGDRLDEVLRG